jgi:hypothetical protein
VILASDSLVDVREVCTHVALYDGGTVGLVGPPDALLANPAAIRWLAHVLPGATSERVLEIIRQDTEIPTAPESRGVPTEAPPAASGPKPATAKTGPLFPSPEMKAPPSTAPAATDSVNHQKLAQLARPAAASRPTLGAGTKSPHNG